MPQRTHQVSRRIQRVCRMQNSVSSLFRNSTLETVRDCETTMKTKFSLFEGGGALGAERKIVQNAFFFSWVTPQKKLKVQSLLSRKFVVIAQAPKQYSARFQQLSRVWPTEDLGSRPFLRQQLLVGRLPGWAQDRALLSLPSRSRSKASSISTRGA